MMPHPFDAFITGAANTGIAVAVLLFVTRYFMSAIDRKDTHIAEVAKTTAAHMAAVAKDARDESAEGRALMREITEKFADSLEGLRDEMRRWPSGPCSAAPYRRASANGATHEE